jgi:hypothetical protein
VEAEVKNLFAEFSSNVTVTGAWPTFNLYFTAEAGIVGAVTATFSVALASPTGTASITTVQTGALAVGGIYAIAITPEPYKGYYTLEVDGKTTEEIQWDADAETVQDQLESLSTVGPGNVTISGDSPNYVMTFASSLEAIEVDIDGSNLIVPLGRKGELNTNTSGIIELLNGAARVNAKLEIELYDDEAETSWTVIQTDCVVLEDVIGSNPATVPAFPSLLASTLGTLAPVEWEGDNPNIPENLTVTGISTPSGYESVTVTTTTELEGYSAWLGEPPLASLYVSRSSGDWTVQLYDVDNLYVATKTSTALTPVGLTDWTVTTGAGQPVINGDNPIGSFIGQLCRAGESSPYDWFAWNGTSWDSLT